MPTARARSKRLRIPARAAVAAGGVVVRAGEREPEVVLAGRHSDRTWVFPKGTPDGDESIEETAVREVREETGLEVAIVGQIGQLGQIDYWFVAAGERIHKVVHFFLMTATGGDVGRHDHEYDEVRWVPATEARALLSYQTYRQVLDRALEAFGS